MGTGGSDGVFSVGSTTGSKRYDVVSSTMKAGSDDVIFVWTDPVAVADSGLSLCKDRADPLASGRSDEGRSP